MSPLCATEFRRTCLALLEHLPPEGVIITKRGRPVAKLSAIRRSCVDLMGSVPDLKVDPNDDLFSTGRRWNAES